MTDDLEVLAPTGASVSFRGEQIEVLPLTIGAIPKIVREARPAIDMILDRNVDNLGDDGMIALVIELTELHGEAVVRAVALAVDKPAEFIAKGNGAEFIELAFEVYKVNRDFFAQRLAPLLANLRGAKAGLSSGDGQTPSSS